MRQEASRSLVRLAALILTLGLAAGFANPAFSGTSLPACSDGLDNDLDGRIDFPVDTDRSSPAENSEAGQCNDGIALDVRDEVSRSEDPASFECGASAERGLESVRVGTGPRHVLALVVDFLDSNVSQTVFSGADPVERVTGILYDDPLTVDGVYQQASFGQISLVRNTVFHINIGLFAIGSCDFSTWSDLADAVAEGLGINLGSYDHIMYIVPSTTSCGWAGQAVIGGVRSWIRHANPRVYAHQLGHNLGMRHASTDPDNDGLVDEEYGDTSGIMGLTLNNWIQFNAPHTEQMHWMPASQILEIVGAGPQIHTISALELDPAVATHPQILKIPRPVAPSRPPYYLSYRAPIGYDATLSPSYLDRTQVHTFPGPVNRTLYITGLGDGMAFSDPAGFNLIVTQLAHDATSATVQIFRDDPDPDGDGYDLSVDCVNADPTIFPGAPQLCDDANNDCNHPSWPALTGTNEFDDDGDGVTECQGDCDDGNPDLGGGETNDGLDNSCPGECGYGVIDEIGCDLGFQNPTDNGEFTWPDQGGATLYQVVRSTSPQFVPDCTAFETSTPVWSDPELPPAGQVYSYLVRALAPHTGGFGQDSTGAGRTIVCGSETDCDDGLDNDGDLAIDCEDSDCVCPFTFSDTFGDDIGTTDLFDYFAALTVAPTDHLFVGFSTDVGDWEFCYERADFYRDGYLAFAAGGGTAASGGWMRWRRSPITGNAWTSWAVPGLARFGLSCPGQPYTFCAEVPGGVGGAFINPILTNQCELNVTETGGCGAGTWTLTVTKAATRVEACGF